MVWGEADTHTDGMEGCHWCMFGPGHNHLFFSPCLHRWNSNKSLSHHPTNNMPDLADTGSGSVFGCIRTHTLQKNRPSHPSTRCLFITLPVFLSLSHKQKYCMLLSRGYLFCVCVCVYPSGNSCPDGISSFREACNQLIRRCSSLKPGG